MNQPSPNILQAANSVANEIANEYAWARTKHAPMHGAHEGYAVILEELEELWECVREKNPRAPEVRAKMRKEAIQIAAMALAFALEVCDQ